MTTHLPDGFISQMQEIIGDKQTSALCDALQRQASVAIRLNNLKPCKMPEWFSDTTPVPWCNNGYYLNDRPMFTFASQLHAGGFYVQDASSMFHEYILTKLSDTKPLCYLDACAAPGGKTTAAINSLPSGSLIVANEFVPLRAQILKENIQKWGYPNVIVTNSSTDKFNKFSGMFDIVAIDAPCSGEGMMRKDEDARRQWSVGLINECTSLQWEIICNTWNSLKSDGYLIYSTCTFNRQENEMIVERICQDLNGETIDLQIPDEWGISKGIGTDLHCYRFMPHITRGEGLFVSVIRKLSEQSEWKPRKAKRQNKPTKLPSIDWLSNDNWHYREHIGVISAIDNRYRDITEEICANAKTLMTGIEIATIKGKDLIPQHGLALSSALKSDAFHRIEVDYTTAIDYLRRETITLPAETPRGYIIICHNNLSLGFVKNLGNRANNLYPHEWRIRTSLPK